MVSGDRDDSGFAKTMKNAHFIAVPYDKNQLASIRTKYPPDHWPHPVVFNGKTAEVMIRNAWGKLSVESLNTMIANL